MKEENKTLTTPEGYTITFRERESVERSLNISKDTLKLLEEIANKKNLTITSVIKFFISKGVRDLEPELAKELAIKRFKSRKRMKINQKLI